jgi:hypothetical protein
MHHFQPCEKRYITIAEHYRTLAEAAKRVRINKGLSPPGVAGETR